MAFFYRRFKDFEDFADWIADYTEFRSRMTGILSTDFTERCADEKTCSSTNSCRPLTMDEYHKYYDYHYYHKYHYSSWVFLISCLEKKKRKAWIRAWKK